MGSIYDEVNAAREERRKIANQMGEGFVELRNAFTFDTSLVLGRTNLFTQMDSVVENIEEYEESLNLDNEK